MKVKKKLSRQEFALKNPYFKPWDFNPGVKKIVHLGGLRISSVLCVDVYDFQPPAWHASAAILSPDMMPVKMVNNISVEDFEAVMGHLISLLELVGEGERWTLNAPDKVVHLYKKLSAEEIARLKKSPAYGN